MSDSIKGLVVTLEPGVRDDDAQEIINAIKMIRRVIDVVPGAEDVNHIMAVAQAKHEMRKKIYAALQ